MVQDDEVDDDAVDDEVDDEGCDKFGHCCSLIVWIVCTVDNYNMFQRNLKTLTKTLQSEGNNRRTYRSHAPETDGIEYERGKQYLMYNKPFFITKNKHKQQSSFNQIHTNNNK